MKRLHPATRILLVLGLIAMGLAWSRPAWQILLWAPQYPEGLSMEIWLDNITGDVDVINGLNHYIGMREIEVEAFPEFGFMKALLIALMAIGTLPVITGRRTFLWIFVAMLLVSAIAGLADFWYWSREYGHNLDPKAAISVPGMTYDPPLLGYKAILNFVAFSSPATGGYLIIGAGVLATVLLCWEIRRGRSAKSTPKPSTSGAASIVATVPILFLSGCGRGPVPIEYGKVDCAGCSMKLVDKRYGTQYVTGKGKVSIFDDVNCLMEHIQRDPSTGDDGALCYVVDFNRPGTLIDATRAVYVHDRSLRSPMRADLAAFGDLSSAQAALKDFGGGGKILSWEEVKVKFKPAS